MLKQEYPKFEKGSFEGIEISLSEPNVKINLRGKKKEFFTKIGKILSIILPIEPNTSSSNQQDRKSTRLNSSHSQQSRMPSSA